MTVKLYNADCLEILPTLEGVDSILTDPPYGINHSTSYGASWENTNIAGDEDTRVRDDVVFWAKRYGIPCAMFGTWKQSAPEGCRATLVWDKGPAFGMGDLSFPWKPSWEHIYILGNGWQGRRDEGVLRGPVVVSWESKGRVHPHQKPVWIFKKLLDKLPSVKTVLDPFMGSGTVGLACVQAGIDFIGIEIDPTYFAIAEKRIRQAEQEVANESKFFGEETKRCEPSFLS